MSTDDRPPVIITLNQTFLDDLGEERTHLYVETLARVAETHRGRPQDEIEDALTQAFDEVGIKTNAVVRERMAERFTNDNWSEVLIRTDHGVRLHGPDWDPLKHVPDNRDTSDPENPERPLYT